MSDPFDEQLEFEWDSGNIDKNWVKYKVDQKEIESVFRDKFSLVADDNDHSQYEIRYQIVGKSEKLKILVIIFTFRFKKIRIISARIASKKERHFYEKNK